jgi:hypothetical protein
MVDSKAEFCWNNNYLFKQEHWGCSIDGFDLTVGYIHQGIWWWEVWCSNDKTRISGDDGAGLTFPCAQSLKEACYFAELFVKHHKQYKNFQLVYLSHTPPLQNLPQTRGVDEE